MKRTILKFATAATAVLSIVAVAPQASGAKVVPITNQLKTFTAADINLSGGTKNVYGGEHPNNPGTGYQMTTVTVTKPTLTAIAWAQVTVAMEQYLCSNGRCAWFTVPQWKTQETVGSAVPWPIILNSDGIAAQGGATFGVASSASKVRLVYGVRAGNNLTSVPSAAKVQVRVTIS